jgi:hypothetical protein
VRLNQRSKRVFVELNLFFKSIIDRDLCPIVVCDTKHTMIYMNPKAISNYDKRGGVSLVGKSLLGCHNPNSAFKISEVLHWFNDSKENNIIHTFYDEKNNKDGYMVALRNNDVKLIGYYENHGYRNKDNQPFYSFG